jgi:hypothetical protein
MPIVHTVKTVVVLFAADDLSQYFHAFEVPQHSWCLTYPTLPEAGSTREKNFFNLPTSQSRIQTDTFSFSRLHYNTTYILLIYMRYFETSSYNIKSAWLAQSVERETLMFHSLTRRLIHLHLKVAGSTPASGFSFCVCFGSCFFLGWVVVGRSEGHVMGPWAPTTTTTTNTTLLTRSTHVPRALFHHANFDYGDYLCEVGSGICTRQCIRSGLLFCTIKHSPRPVSNRTVIPLSLESTSYFRRSRLTVESMSKRCDISTRYAITYGLNHAMCTINLGLLLIPMTVTRLVF